MSEPEEEDFEKLFEASTKTTRAKRFEKGQTIEGTIVTIGADWALVDVQLEALTQPSWARPVAFDPTLALRLSFWAEDASFDFWIDDVELYQ